jgi:formylglycine-generating enzyme required for sulfatase activity
MHNRSVNNVKAGIGSGGSRALLLALAISAVAATLLACGNTATGDGPAAGDGSAVKLSVAGQNGILTAGTTGSATFAVSTANLADGTQCVVAWLQDAQGANRIDPPAGLSAQISPVSANAALVTALMGSSASAGAYYFRVISGSAISAAVKVVVSQTSTPSLTLGAQNGTLAAGAAASATFAVTTTLADGNYGLFTWYTGPEATTTSAAPAGIVAAITPTAGGSATVTLTSNSQSVAGSYYFRIFETGAVSSNVATLTIGPAQAAPSVSLGAQTGTITAGSAGGVYFSATTQNLADGTTGSILWSSGAAPTGISVAVAQVWAGAAAVTVTATAQAVAGTYDFRLVENSTIYSNLATLTIASAPAAASVYLGAQNGIIYASSAGSATFPATTTNVPAGTTGSIIWSAGAAPTGISAAVSQVSANAATVTMTASAYAAAGSYQFTLREGSTSSAPATLTVSAAQAPTLRLGSQTGSLTSGAVGSATYELATEHLADGTICSCSWFETSSGIGSALSSPPFGISPSVTPVSSGASTVTMTSNDAAIEGTWYFRVRTDSGYASNIVAFTVQRAPVPAFAMLPVAGGSFSNGFGLVTLSSFYISKHEITQDLYQSVMGSNPSDASSNGIRLAPAYPVNRVSWYAAIVFCNKLSMREARTPVYTISGSTDPKNWGSIPTSFNSTWNAVTQNFSASGYRLPTEAEWDYAAIGGASSMNYKYSGGNVLNAVAWNGNNSNLYLHPVGIKAPNELGICDMSGGVREWVWDWYTGYPPTSPTTDPAGPATGSTHNLLGEEYQVTGDSYFALKDSNGKFKRTTRVDPSDADDLTGFRVVRR